MDIQPPAAISRRHFVTACSVLGLTGLGLSGCATRLSDIVDPYCVSQDPGPNSAPRRKLRASPVPVDNFTPRLRAPVSYETMLPDFRNAYICASLARLARKESVNAAHTDDVYRQAMIRTLRNWGFRSSRKPIVINSRFANCGAPGTQGLIIYHRRTAFIVFRSTERKLNDWATNLNTFKSENPFGNGRVHSGFLRAFNNVECVIEDELASLRKANAVWIMGHSLGAAIAILAAAYLLKNEIKASGLYTFGGPRVGDDDFRNDMNRRLTYRFWRFVNRNDLVADLPLSTFPLPLPGTNFHRAGSILQLDGDRYVVLRRVDSTGSWHKCDNFYGASTRDHSTSGYRGSLRALIARRYAGFPEMNFHQIT